MHFLNWYHYFNSKSIDSKHPHHHHHSQKQNIMEIDKSWAASKKCYFRIVNRLKDGIENDVVFAIADKIQDPKW